MNCHLGTSGFVHLHIALDFNNFFEVSVVFTFQSDLILLSSCLVNGSKNLTSHNINVGGGEEGGEEEGGGKGFCSPHLSK